MRRPEDIPVPSRDLSVSFGYQCSTASPPDSVNLPNGIYFSGGSAIQNSNLKTSSSFSCLSGAALSANATLANTNICNGFIGEEILPSLDSPRSFKRMASSPSLSRVDSVFSLSQSSMTTSGGSPSMENDFIESERNLWKSMSAPTRIESSSFLNAVDVQMAGGAAGEDRVQAVCSEENGWLFCGIYDGFNGRDAADFLAGTLYENIGLYLHLLEWRAKKQHDSLDNTLEDDTIRNEMFGHIATSISDSGRIGTIVPHSLGGKFTCEDFNHSVTDCLIQAVAQAESDFMYMVEQEMEDRPDLVSVGSCVLVGLLHGNNFYVLNLGDSRAILATNESQEDGKLKAIQLTETHTLDNEIEYRRLLDDHPEDPSPVTNGRVKGKLKLTRAFGVGYLKKVLILFLPFFFFFFLAGKGGGCYVLHQ